MKIGRAILAGGMMWIMVLTSFLMLSFVLGVKESEDRQVAIIAFFLVVYSSLTAAFYYKSGDNTNGALVGVVMSTVALLLDVTITVPFVEIPKGSSYVAFFSNPLLWVLVAENILFVYFYWKWKEVLP